jgi:hypothetical protein
LLFLQRVALGLVFACLSACEQQAHQAKPQVRNQQVMTIGLFVMAFSGSNKVTGNYFGALMN